MIDSTRRRITLSYRVAILLVGLVVILIALITGHLVDQQLGDTTILNIAGKQRMWSQRIALLANHLEHVDNEDRRITLQLLRNATDSMERSHELLIHHTQMDSLFSPNEAYRQFYFEPPEMLDAQVRDYLSHAHHILQLTPGQVTQTQPDIVAINDESTTRLIDSLDAAVTIYQHETIARFRLLHSIVVGLSAFGLLMLAVIALFVFKPAIAFVGQAQKRLIELNQLKGDFLANMSHEIRTPMNGIFGMTELLLESELNTRQQHYVRTLQNSADHLLGLINDILDFSKLEAGQMKLDPVRFNLLTTLEDVFDLLGSRAREKNLELLMRYVPGTPRFLTADPGRIRQILFNLIGNAIKFTDHGYVMVEIDMLPTEKATTRQPWLSVKVEDTGIGIPEDKIGHLFEKFMQVESGSNRAQQGTGLGLAICRNLVRLMGGDIIVQSMPGKGTSFTWHIPVAEASDPQPASSPHALLANRTVLLVDDLAPNRLLYKEALTSAGVTCLVAENAQEAYSTLSYAAANKQPIDAVITDYMMPHGDGIQLTRAIRNDARFETLPIIILSSAGEHGLIKQFEAAGANAFLTKPTTRQQLYDMLVHVIDAAQRGEPQCIITSEASAAFNANRLMVRHRPLTGRHILLVEDNRVNLEITTEILHLFGCEVATAVNGHEAIAAAKTHAFDLILMDCQMPEMDGFEAAQHLSALKANGTIAPVPIVALTANALKGDRERCLESGMDDYLSKPVRKATLEAVLLKWLTADTPDTKASEHSWIADAAAAHAPVAATDCGIDMHVFAIAQQTLGLKLPTILSYYLEDADSYLHRIHDAITRHDPAAAIIPAHTLKSSSRQLGAHQLADLAEKTESIARKGGTDAITQLAELIPLMQDLLTQAKPFFRLMKVA